MGNRRRPKKETVSLEILESNKDRRVGDMKLLIIDDNRDLVKLMKCQFMSSGYTVKTAFAGYEVLELIRSGYIPDIIILDLYLPEISGTELLATLINRWEFVRIYIHSGHTENTSAFSRSVCGCFRKGEHSVKDMIKVIGKENFAIKS
jgi:CheY-like chemotaxis protein